MKLKFMYCQPCRNWAQALKDLDQIYLDHNNDIESVELVAGAGGVYDVHKDAKLVYSKDKEGRMPEDGQVSKLLPADSVRRVGGRWRGEGCAPDTPSASATRSRRVGVRRVAARVPVRSARVRAGRNGARRRFARDAGTGLRVRRGPGGSRSVGRFRAARRQGQDLKQANLTYR